jgi:hypothetical protein
LFGDGHQRLNTTGERLPKGSGSFTVRLHGTKADMYEWFAALPQSNNRNGHDRPNGISISSITKPDWAKGEWVVQGWSSFNVKTWPRVGADAAYLRGFLSGWIRADASARAGNTSMVLAAQLHPEHGDVSPQQWLERHAAAAGWLLLGSSCNVRTTNFGPRSAPLYNFTLAQDHQRARGWRVESIKALPGEQQVYCLTVPGTKRFTLASGITSANCALSYRQKPYRQRTVEYVVDYAKNLQDNLGSTRMAPFAPDLPMHTQRRRLIVELLEKVSDEVDAASMRVDDFTADNTFILLQVHGGMDAVTLGVEGNSQRMRDLVGKGTSDGDIKEAVTRGIRAGIRKFKLFMISNLPGEDEGDVYRILKLAKDLADIRESMGQPTVRIQFSWTPLMIEANTPFQWFAPQPASRILGDVWEELRDLKIDFKIGAKAEPNKIAFFQLCQRASRDVGEALVDAMLEVDQACWGGVPRTFADLIESKLHERGFHNGYADCFDERYKHDMFGWEFIDQGISNELLWSTYVQMREFVEQTDSHSYDLHFDGTYHGSEWLMRCLAKGTRVRLADGTTRPIEELVGQEVRVLTLDVETGESVSSLAPLVWEVGERNDLVEIEFDDGHVLRCTPDHKVMLPDGAFREARDLVEGDEVATAEWPEKQGVQPHIWAQIDEAFWSQVEVGDVPTRWGSATGVEFDGSPCLNWTGLTANDGYGIFRLRSLGQIFAYSYVWIMRNGFVPEDKVLNHMCHNRLCVRHLEVCTVGENTAQAWRSQPLCRAGKHANKPENWNWVNGRPRCRFCVNEAAEAYQERKAASSGRARWRNGQAICRNNHEYTEENTRWYVRKKTGKPARHCRACARDAEERRKLRRLAQGGVKREGEGNSVGQRTDEGL